MLETVIAWIVVAATAAMVVFMFYRAVTGKGGKGGCGSCCGLDNACSMKDACEDESAPSVTPKPGNQD